MVLVPGGTFTMGSERFYPEERPLRRVHVDPFRIDATPVTNRQFARFVAETGHHTQAEIAPDPRDYPGMLPEMARAGSLVFRKTSGPVPMEDVTQWWEFCFGADWRHPYGPDSDLDALDLWDHPVVHVAWPDAAAYAKWAGKELPTEAEHEFAARGGLEGQEFAWGDELAPGGRMLANYWQGLFPFSNTREDGWERTSPVRSYPPNGFGLFDMIGNVWEWTADWWAENPAKALKAKKAGDSCCAVRNLRGGKLKDSFDPGQPQVRIGRKVIKGGSHLCAVNYCQRFRPAARHPEMIDTSTSHIGFRCVRRN
ncbi:formylglycine-generating enzyme family protein [Novosphingobium sp. TH158]|uniref:formylglycine-generating enzyme family protein n=1 Tax=Novosphingobium sp. TH158 TaxID=2067455 RepID=UPI000C7C102F|nr:formylglycine-generating enzyme family protein [Novosphingobium sp. TH158]PLK24005.1 gliding motility-associated lipoprotein GldK [Novosphingobium sp. TH158]